MGNPINAEKTKKTEKTVTKEPKCPKIGATTSGS
jgi:hypothetical protein